MHTRPDTMPGGARTILRAMLACLLVLGVAAAQAQGSRIRATSGATQLEGAAGGGIVPWALIAGYDSDEEIGGAAFLTQVSLDDLELRSAGLAIGIHDRFEIGYARQTLRVQPLDLDIEQDIVGAKWRLAGDVVYSRWPQLSLGIQYKHNRDFAVPALLGAADDEGIDTYLAASKLFLGGVFGRNLLVNGTLRRGRANQAGLLGFGREGAVKSDWSAEGSVALFLDHRLAIGLEYRAIPDRLDARAQDWSDAFIAWFPTKRLSVVLAHARLGDVAGLPDQSGWYLSLQAVH